MKKTGGLRINLEGLDGKQTVDQMKELTAMKFAAIGEEYVNEARSKRLNLSGLPPHQHDTKNLLNSHSFAVFIDGVSRYSKIGEKGDVTMAMFERVKKGKGVELIVGNGREYASYVEGRGFDVVASGTLKVEKDARDMFKNLDNDNN